MKILLLGDIVGRVGRRAVADRLSELTRTHQIDFTIANGENAAAGLGLTEKTGQFLFDCGIDCLTSGNHIWAQREVREYLPREPRVLRPANYPEGAPGHGCHVFSYGSGDQIAVINLLGRVFMDAVDCPFRKADHLLASLPPVAATIVDFHAEATSEKQALGRYLDGRVTAVIGTHTHVQTADEIVLPGGTAYLTDAGMTGPADSVIGIKPEIAVQRFLTALPTRFEVSRRGACILSGVVIECNRQTGLAKSIYRLQELVPAN